MSTNDRFLCSICIWKYSYNKNLLWREGIPPSLSALSRWYFSKGNFTNWKRILYFEGIWSQFKNVCQKAIKTNSSSFCNTPNVQMFRYHVIKMKYNGLAFVYYSIIFWDFKSLQSVPKTWEVLEAKNIFLKRCPNIEIPFFMISSPDFSLFFQVITGTA